MVTIITFFLVVAVSIFLPFYLTRRQKNNTVSSLFFANRRLRFYMVAVTLLFTNITASEFVGENEAVYNNNMSVMAWGVTSIAAMIIVSEFILPFFIKLGISTMPEFLGSRYNNSIKHLATILLIVGYCINLLPGSLFGGAVVLNGIFNIDELLHITYFQAICVCVWFMGTVGCISAIVGGLRNIAFSSVVFGVGLFICGVVFPYMAVKYLGDGSFSIGAEKLLTTKTSYFNAIGSPTDNVPFSTLFTGMLLMNLYYWGAEQYIIQLALSSRSLSEGQKGVTMAAFGKLTLPILLCLPGIVAAHLYPSEENSVNIFSHLINDVSGPFFKGFFGAIIFGSVITTFGPGIHGSCTMFVLNLYQPWMKKKHKELNEKKLLGAARVFEFSISLLAMLVAPLILFYEKGLYTYVQTIAGAISVPLFTIIFMGIVSRHASPVTARVGLAFFVSVYIFSQLVYDAGIHFIHILGILFVCTVALMHAVSHFYPMKEAYKPVWNSIVNTTPWKNRFIIYLILLALMMGLYILCSPLVLVKE